MKIEEPSTLTLVIAVLAAVFGAGGFVFLFSDLSPRETIAMRFVIGGLYFLGMGALIGFFHPARWILAGLIGWSGLLMGLPLTVAALRGVSMSPDGPYLSAALAMLFLPLILSLLGGFLGSRLGNRLVGKSTAHPA